MAEINFQWSNLTLNKSVWILKQKTRILDPIFKFEWIFNWIYKSWKKGNFNRIHEISNKNFYKFLANNIMANNINNNIMNKNIIWLHFLMKKLIINENEYLAI